VNFKFRLVLLFVLLYAVTLSITLSLVYIQFDEFRREEFFQRIQDKALLTARLLGDVQARDRDLLRILDENSIHQMFDEKILVFDEQNQLIYSSLDDEPILYSNHLLRQIRSGTNKYFVDDDGDEVIGVHFSEQGKNYVILASAYDKFGQTKLRNLRRTLILAGFLSLAIILSASWFYVRQIFKPLKDINASIKTITENNLKDYVPERQTTDELDELVRNYNRMLERLQTYFESQRAFVRNASHELKTPIAVLQHRIDDLLDEVRPERREQLQEARDLTVSLAGMLDSLLLLQRLESTFPFPKTRVRLDELLSEVQALIRELYPEFKVRIDLDDSLESEDDLYVSANEMLVNLAFRNLLTNGALYSADHEMEVRFFRENNRLLIEFSNAGSIALDEKNLFEPFYRGEGVQTIPGSGLGLSVVRQIIQTFGGQMAYEFKDGRHMFKLEWPSA
jgi:two-component system, OmpR family, sensor histidine kinase ArlS